MADAETTAGIGEPMPGHAPTHGLCRDCAKTVNAALLRCPTCHGVRIVRHPELHALSIAHLDCDAFYATVEKRDRPALQDRPVIIGGGRRGVVAAACYVARMSGVRSAMPMFKALQACPDAVVIRPDMPKYVAVGRQIRTLMTAMTPLVEPLSIDEAFLDLSGTERLHARTPAETCAHLAGLIEREVGVTVSIGLSYNKFLAKVASDLDKPRGFAVLGRADAPGFLAEQPVGLIWGVGKALQERLHRDGIRQIGQLLPLEERDLVLRYGGMGRRLWHFARGIDHRRVDPETAIKSVSSETTFDRDYGAYQDLSPRLWRLCESVAARLKAKGLAGGTVVLKLKTAAFKGLTRSETLSAPTQLADTLFRTADALLKGELARHPPDQSVAYRLIGVGCQDLAPASLADPPDLADPDLPRRKRVEATIDAVRAKLGDTAITKGRGLRAE